VDIRTGSGGPSTSSAISDSTHSTLTYLETLPAYEKTVEGLLNISQSERSWLMGQKDPPSPARNANEEGGIVNLYVGTCYLAFVLLDDATLTGSRCARHVVDLLGRPVAVDETSNRTSVPA